MKPAPRGIAPTVLDLLRQHPAAGGLLPTVERHIGLLQDLNLLAPDLTATNARAHLNEDGTLVIRARSAALAGKLRQSTPSLLAGLARRGWKINAIQVRVQPLLNTLESITYQERPKTARLPGPALECWRELAGTLGESPLRDAVARLLRHHGKR